MAPYWILFCLLTLWYVVTDRAKPRRVRPVFDLVILTVLVVFAGIRWDCDNDFLNYFGMYRDAPTIANALDSWGYYSSLWDVEPAFLATNILWKSLGLPFVSLLFAISLFVVVSSWMSIKRLLPEQFRTVFYLYICTLYLTQPFTQMRFGIVTALTLLAIWLMIDLCRKRALLLQLFGAGFQSVSIFALPLHALLYVRRRRIILWSLLAVSLALQFIDFRFLFDYVVTVRVRYHNYSLEDTSTRITAYVLSMMFFVLAMTKKINYSDNQKYVFLVGCALVLVYSAVFRDIPFLNRASVLLYFAAYACLAMYVGRRFEFVPLIVAIGFVRFAPTVTNFVTAYQTVFSQW